MSVPSRVAGPAALAATSRETVEGARPSRRAMTVSDSPARTPTRISSRSAMPRQPDRGFHRSGKPVVNRPARTIRPTIGAEQPTSRAMSTKLQNMGPESECQLFLVVREDPCPDVAPVIEGLGSSQDQCANRWIPPSLSTSQPVSGVRPRGIPTYTDRRLGAAWPSRQRDRRRGCRWLRAARPLARIMLLRGAGAWYRASCLGQKQRRTGQ